MKHAPTDSLILEFEPGQGLYSRQLAGRGYEIIGIHPLNQPVIENPCLSEIHQKNPEEILFPYQHFGGIWAPSCLLGLDEAKAITRLSLFYDWLSREGILYFCVPEGEGHKVVTEHTPAGKKDKIVVYYNPEQLDDMLRQGGFNVIEAFREQRTDRAWLHVIAKRP